MAKSELARYIAYLRVKAGFRSFEELARASTVSAPTIFRIENGQIKEPRFDTIQKLATTLDVSPFDLMEKAGMIPNIGEMLKRKKTAITLKTLIEFLENPYNLSQLAPEVLTTIKSYIDSALNFTDKSPLSPREFQQLDEYKNFLISKRGETKIKPDPSS